MTPCTSRHRRLLAEAGLLLVLLLIAGAVSAQTCGVAENYFQVDGQFFSSGSAVDWAKGLSGLGVFDDAGNAVLTPALRLDTQGLDSGRARNENRKIVILP
jgi:hypothetical protein